MKDLRKPILTISVLQLVFALFANIAVYMGSAAAVIPPKNS